MDEALVCRELAAFEAAGGAFDRLLKEAVRLIHQSSPRFHRTGICELFPDDVLRLAPSIGAETDHTATRRECA